MDRFRKNCSDCSSIAVLLAVIICILLTGDSGTTAALCWLAVVFSVYFFMRPFTGFMCVDYPDGAFALRFGAGLILCFYPTWIISMLTKAPFSDLLIFAVFILFAISGFFLNRSVKKKPYIERAELSAALRGFAIFAVIFFFFFWVIGFNPLVDSGTENYMDFGFMQTIYRQKAAVPNDMWFSGTKLNYYYLGQSVSVYMCRLSKTTPEYGYNLMLSTFAGMVFSMVFELTTGICNYLFSDIPKKRIFAVAGGLMGAMTAAFSANAHWFVFGVIGNYLAKASGAENPDQYWFPDCTVYINSSFGDPDNGKNEFPAYSVVLGDLHAHVINLIFVLPLLAVLFDYAMRRKKGGKIDRKDIYRLTLMAVLLGYYKGSNYWDFAIYYVIAGAMIVFSEIKMNGASRRSVLNILFEAVYITAVSFIVNLPFSVNFMKMESGFALCETHTPLSKLVLLWGVPVAVALSLMTRLLLKSTYFVNRKTPAVAAVVSLILCTTGLVLVPEVIYVIDIYGADNKRFNTMFKLTYQAYTLFGVIIGIAFAVALVRAFSKEFKTVAQIVYTALFLSVALLAASYMPYSVHQWFGDVYKPSERIGISSLEGLRDDPSYGFEMLAADELNKDDARLVNIVEAAGDSYTHESALSVYSGATTPLGWYVHEWMWHNDSEQVNERADDIKRFYCSGSEDYCRDFLKKYDTDYIFVGPAEVSKYPVNREGFEKLGSVCLSEMWQGVKLELIRVDRSKL